MTSDTIAIKYHHFCQLIKIKVLYSELIFLYFSEKTTSFFLMPYTAFPSLLGYIICGRIILVVPIEMEIAISENTIKFVV
ncbi:hypothetical protein [Nodularia spumigena]|uniref:Uncharacterized protein n=1 Tax=Nodularia spumigena CENA596 TaxID=1819295 RepID=A0A161XJ08_NODSP|nr:hypothetical protein [Nodularia spumigena]MDB9321170.1 hypothetical protein [Nodularia spumigena CS-591/07A]MDB9325079.1 hypothetical protein [Nodularia spumigena CS-590/02]MDB9331731.1 hypothetical protein [Nodularia spumigena CS-591/04]MDB9401600.1 hypothetical protein [Microcystis aeruginosa CS-567/02-A1]MDB9533010.1 hypothetical protein [Nodularia spumigena CS-1038]